MQRPRSVEMQKVNIGNSAFDDPLGKDEHESFLHGRADRTIEGRKSDGNRQRYET